MWNAVDHLLEEAIRENAFPGCAIAAGQRGKVLYTNVSGYLVRDGERQVCRPTFCCRRKPAATRTRWARCCGIRWPAR